MIPAYRLDGYNVGGERTVIRFVPCESYNDLLREIQRMTKDYPKLNVIEPHNVFVKEHSCLLTNSL